MNTTGRISFAQNNIALKANNLATTINQQIVNSSRMDEQPGIDEAMNAPGQVRVDQADSFVQLSYDPQAQQPKSFEFKVKQDLKTPDGQVLMPAGTESTFTRSDDGVQTYEQKVPTPQGTYCQKAVVDDATQTIDYNERIING